MFDIIFGSFSSIDLYRIQSAFWEDFGTILKFKVDEKSIKNLVDLFIDYWMLFGRLFGTDDDQYVTCELQRGGGSAGTVFWILTE